MPETMQGIALDDLENKKARICEMISQSVNGTFSHACKSVGISKSSGYDLMAADPQFKINVDKARAKARESGLDYVESKLLSSVRDGNITAIIFFLKCLGRERGFVDKLDMNLKTTSTTNITVVHDATAEFRQILGALAESKASGGALPPTLDQLSPPQPDNTVG